MERTFEFVGINAILGVPMGIRFLCPNGHKLNVKTFLAGKRAICPQCGAKVIVPVSSESQAADLSQQASGIEPSPFAGPPPLDSASASVIIAVASSDVAGPSVAASGPVVPPAVGGLPESAYIAPRPLIDVAEPDANPSDVQRELRRDHTRQTQMAIAVVLFMLVIVLAGVLIWVLQRNTSPSAEEEARPVSANEFSAPHSVAAAPRVLAYGSSLI
jgi:hypothetical protein